MSEEKNNPNSSLSTFLSGIVLGAAVTYLFTTDSGRKIKDELLKEGTKIIGSIGDEFEKAKADVEEKKVEVQKRITETTSDISDIKENVGDAISQVTEVVTEQIPQEVEKIQKKGRHFFFSKKHSSTEG